MNFTFKTIAAFCVATAITASSFAASLFLSTSADDPLANGPLNLAPGESGMAWLWILPGADEGKIVGPSMSVVSSDPAVLEATAHEVFNPVYLGGGAKRWDGTPGAGTLGDLVIGTLGVSVTSGGIDDTGLAGLDPGAVAIGNSRYFRYSKITFDATGAGTTVLTAQNGPQPFAISGSTVGVPPTPGTLTVNVGGVIPEPSTLALVGLGLIGLVGYARRR